MDIKKIIIYIYIPILILVTGCSTTSDLNIVYNKNIEVRGLSLKTALIQTGYELYSINNDNTDLSEDSYKDISREAHKHYKWLKSTYSSMTTDMTYRLESIFKSHSQWDYLNEVVSLDDNATFTQIIDSITSSNNLNLSLAEKENLTLFFDFFYDNYFKSYFNKYEKKLNNNAKKLNNLIVKNDIDLIKFIEDTSGIDFESNYKSIFYYNFNPFQTQVFKYDNMIISTVQPSINAQDILSICFYQYSNYLFDSFVSSTDFIDICKNLKHDLKFVSKYNEIGKNSYDFNTWCKENLVAGFSKYLDYRFNQSDYQFTSYTYDLDFYNHLRDIGFNPKTMNLKDISISFYEDKVENLVAYSNQKK